MKTSEFIKQLIPTWLVEYNQNCNTVIQTWDLKPWMDNIYFCWPTKNNTIRSNKKDIENKNYFCLDYDIRQTIKDKTDKIIEDIDLFSYWRELKQKLDQHELLKDYRFIVFSGNWYHVYYTTDKRNYNQDHYEYWVDYVNKLSDEYMKEYYFVTDKSCRTVNRILRLPWSYNTKRVDKHGLDKMECTVTNSVDRHCKIFDNFSQYYDEIMKSKKIEQTKNSLTTTNYSYKWDSVYEAINQIDISEIVCNHFWLQMQSDWVNFKSNKDGKNMGMFIHDNMLINTWSSKLWSNQPWYSPYSFVKYEMNLDDSWVFERFKRNYKHIDDISINNRKKQEKSDKPIINNPMEYFLSFWELSKKSTQKRQSINTNNLCKYGMNLDDHLQWILPWELVVIWADTWMGKSEIAYNIAIQNAINWKKVALFPLEWDIWEVTYRHLFREIAKRQRVSNIDYRFNKKDFSKIEDQVLSEMDDNLKNNLMIYNKSEKTNLWFLKSIIEKSKDDFDMFIIDHLHYIHLDTQNENREIWEIMRELKLITDVIQKPVVLISHLRKRKTIENPTEYDLYWSSNIAKEATTILLLCKDKDYNKWYQKNESPTRLILAKSRALWLYKEYSSVYFLNDKTYSKREETTVKWDEPKQYI